MENNKSEFQILSKKTKRLTYLSVLAWTCRQDGRRSKQLLWGFFRQEGLYNLYRPNTKNAVVKDNIFRKILAENPEWTKFEVFRALDWNLLSVVLPAICTLAAACMGCVDALIFPGHTRRFVFHSVIFAVFSPTVLVREKLFQIFPVE
jgi:hypothetical protein